MCVSWLWWSNCSSSRISNGFRCVGEFAWTSDNTFIFASNLIAGITGSASGGLAIALDSFAQKFLDIGMNPQVIHRVATMWAFGLDTMPYNSTVIANLNATKLTFKQGYGHQFWLALVIPVIVSFVSAIFVEMGLV